MKRKAESAYEVRAFLQEHFPGVKVSVRLSHSPFGGEDKYAVKVAVPSDVSVISSGGSKEPTKFATSDPQWTATLQNIYDGLKAEFTNVFSS